MRRPDTVRLREIGASLVASEARDAVLIVNPLAGGGRFIPWLDEARRIFHSAGIETELQRDGRSRRSDHTCASRR